MIPQALMIIVPVVALSYILPTMAGLAGWGHWSDWASETGGTSFVQLAQHLGGPILGYIMLGAAVLSKMALYQDWMGPGSRPTCMTARIGCCRRCCARSTPSTARPGSPSSFWLG